MKFFVVLRNPKGFPVAMVDDDIGESIHLFDTKNEAEDATKRNPFGETFGYEIYEW